MREKQLLLLNVSIIQCVDRTVVPYCSVMNNEHKKMTPLPKIPCFCPVNVVFLQAKNIGNIFFDRSEIVGYYPREFTK